MTNIGAGLLTVARVTTSGRIAVSLKFKHAFPDLPSDYALPVDEFAVDSSLSDPQTDIEERAGKKVPKLSIVMMLVGSSGIV